MCMWPSTVASPVRVRLSSALVCFAFLFPCAPPSVNCRLACLCPSSLPAFFPSALLCLVVVAAVGVGGGLGSIVIVAPRVAANTATRLLHVCPSNRVLASSSHVARRTWFSARKVVTSSQMGSLTASRRTRRRASCLVVAVA